ncbi:MAG: hypothetical protein BA864_05045 [Desulfuromonadales bacterium C00003093]|nr:MAG: hypothetical protein BA864_05045 [Desulfuromonadales bacterium C00003093]
MTTKPKEQPESVDFPILRHVDGYLFQGGRIEESHGLICLVDFDGEQIACAPTTKEMLELLIFTIC